MKAGNYISEMDNRKCFVYQVPHCGGECCLCGKQLLKDANALVWADDEENLEYVYGDCCIKKLKLKEITL